jgi:HSP20 family protein
MANIVRRGGSDVAPLREWDPLVREPLRMFRDLLRWDPFREVSAYTDEREMTFYPTFDVRETKDTYLFKADIPGVKEEDLDISITGNRLTISGRRESEERKEGETYYSIERSYGQFNRSFTLPDGVATDDIRAEMKDGVLTLVLPKRPELQPKRISFKKGEKDKEKAKA